MIRPVHVLIIRSTVIVSLVLIFVFLALASQVSPAIGGTPPAPVSNTAVQSDLTTASAPDSPVAQNDNQPATIQDASEECDVSDSFPEEVRQWCGLITRYAKEHEISPDLIAAVIWLESGGNPTAYSRSGAVGLMQVMPRDGLASSFQCANGPCFASRPTREELEDPEYNIEYGTGMLAGLYGRFESWRDALKSYGPMNVGYSYADKILSLYERFGND